MTQATHTPGPWFILLDPETNEPDTSHGFAVQHDSNVLADTIDTEANARLIAATPSLYAYAELEECLSSSIEEQTFRKYGYDGSMMQPSTMRAFMNEVRRAAIAKAKGE